MSQIERDGPSSSVLWIGETLDDNPFQRMLTYAERKIRKTSLLLECYRQGISESFFSQRDLQTMKKSNPAALARLKLALRSRNTATSSMFRCYVAWLNQECLGQYNQAIDLWTTAFFQRSEFLELGKIYNSYFSTDVIPDMFARFSRLLYDKAIQRDGIIDESIEALLEKLSQRHEAFLNLEGDYLQLTDQRNLNMLLARLYWRCGRKGEARKLSDEQFQRVMDLLEDDIGWNDTCGYQLLARMLFTNKQPGKAQVAASLMRFFELGYNIQRGGTDADAMAYRRPLICAGWCTLSDGPQATYDSTTYACTTCANIVFCEGCYQILHDAEIEEEDKIYVCNPAMSF